MWCLLKPRPAQQLASSSSQLWMFNKKVKAKQPTNKTELYPQLSNVWGGDKKIWLWVKSQHKHGAPEDRSIFWDWGFGDVKALMVWQKGPLLASGSPGCNSGFSGLYDSLSSFLEYESISIWLLTVPRLRSQCPLSNIGTAVTFSSVLPPWLKKRTQDREKETETERRQMASRTRTEDLRETE